jgi:hypothetical protein
VTGLLAIIVNPWYWTVFASIYAFWVTLLPAIPIQLAFIFMFKKIINLLQGVKNNDNKRRN